MKTDLCLHASLLLLALTALCGAILPVQADDKAPVSKIAAALQPFVDSHALAGAVTLVANKDKCELEAVGFADIAAHKPMAPTTCSGSLRSRNPSQRPPDDARG